MSLSDIIRQERIKNGISQALLGEKLNVTQQAVAKWEKSLSEPDSATLKKIANLFNVSVDYLLDYSEPTPEERAAGAALTRKANITPIEDELLHAFRRLGNKHGEPTQRSIIDMIEKML